MTDRELGRRVKVRTSMPSLGEFFDPYDRPEEQYQCSICKVFCYLSQITCVCTSSVVCLEHVDSLCQCSDPVVRKTVLRTRFSDGGLRAILQNVAERRSMPEAWVGKLHETLADCARPPIRTLRSILQEGEASGMPAQELHNLRKFVNRANAWIALATSFTSRKPAPRKRGRRPKGYVEPPPDPTSTDVEYTLDEANELLAEADSLGFDSAEIIQLATAVKQATGLRAQVVAALQLPNDPQARNLAKFEVLLADSQALTLRFPEVRSLESAVTYLQLLRELDQVDDSSITLEYVEDLLSRARENNMDSNHEYFVELERKRALGIEWRTQATELLKNKPQIMDQLHKAAVPPSGTPTVPKLANALSAAWTRARDLEKQAKAMISTSREKRATPDESFALIERASDYVIPAMEDLRLLAQRAAKYSGIYKSILAGQYVGIAGHPLENLFQDLITWQTEIRQDLSMMNIAAFTAVDEQLSKHEAWLQTHPWWRRGEHSPQSTELFDQAFVVFQDVIRETRAFTEDLPTPDCTCICTKPVTVVANDTPTAVQCDSCNAKVHFFVIWCSTTV
jgi:[histone H3]-trimethyl-L-lysine4 demethylase